MFFYTLLPLLGKVSWQTAGNANVIRSRMFLAKIVQIPIFFGAIIARSPS